MSARSAATTLAAIGILLAACASDAEKQAPPPVDNRSGRNIVDGWEHISDRVLFAYDSAVISREYQQELQKAARWLSHYPKVTLTIEGHADERGTREYNLALGERRAIALKRALTAFGVPADRLSTVSYGKERPAVVGSDEAAWSQNRRAVMVIN